MAQARELTSYINRGTNGASLNQRWVVWRRLKRHRLAGLGLLVFGLLVFSAVFAPWVVPHDPYKVVPQRALQPPSLSHPFGTDDLGRDVFSRIIFGARVSLQVGLVAVSISSVSGVYLGVAAGFAGGKVDTFVMRAMDIFLAFPPILLAIAIMAILGQGTIQVMVAIGIVYMPVFARVVRGTVLSIKEKEFVEAARAMGAADRSIIWRHVLPGLLDVIIVQATLTLAYAILAEAALSFLGLGTQPPTPSWGAMLSFGRHWMREAPWLSLFPGMAIFVTVLMLNLVGDGLRDALDPRLRNI